MDDKNFLNYEYNSLMEKVPCLGIPVLSQLDSSNESIVIGHHFFNVRESSKIGSYTFSYCFKRKHYVNLPDFTFYTLIISKYSNSDDYGISSFSRSNFKEKIKSIIKPNSDSLKLRYISLHSSGENNCGPIFLKQKFEKIKRRYIESMNYNSCKQAASCICKNKKLMKSKKENLEYAFFTPREGNSFLFKLFKLFIYKLIYLY
ncbi:hypothetical protein C1645_773737 [Glomus cerebriforme]|uniref:DUF7431 domain-containing protein n=1 Tax=Glomus cerebriforme TaxID=658196 RepID=A0A397SVA4_9GLOM|nr:hypothetical protein C1645_773737 [Glomus cerebriforme]